MQLDENFLHQQIGQKFNEEDSKVPYLECSFEWCWTLDTSGSRPQIKYAWNVVRCGAGERWRSSIGPIVWEIKNFYKQPVKERNILQAKNEEG